MMIIPDFYAEFSCKADRCLHTCCAGWEIDIDPQTAQMYTEMPGELGERLRESMKRDGDGWHFIMKNDRCPMLDDRGLCEVILRDGEDALCDICALHPRFYGEIGGIELCGLGLCCERAAELLLARQDRLLFVDEDTGKAVNIACLLEAAGVKADPGKFKYRPRADREHLDHILEVMAGTEPIDAAWTEEIKSLKEYVDAGGGLKDSIGTGAVYQRIFEYILYRQLERVEDRGLPAVLGFAGFSTDFIALAESLWGNLTERVRRWSEQIEYSTENVDIIVETILI